MPDQQIQASDRVYSVKKIQKLRRKIREGLSRVYLNSVNTGEQFDIFVSDFGAYLPKGIEHEVLYEALSGLAGTPITLQVLDSACWRISANLARLKQGTPVKSWGRQPWPEWVPAQIVNAKRKRNNRGDPGWVFAFRILAGLPAGLRITKFWSDKFCYYFARDLGFARWLPSEKSGKLATNQLQHLREFVSMRLSILVDPPLCGREPGFEKVRVKSAAKRWNRLQMKYRDRFDPKCQCPNGFAPTFPCFKCVYGTVSCRAAVHPRDYRIGPCPACGRAKAPFDDKLSVEFCVDCCEKKALQRH